VRANGLDLFSGIGGITLALSPWVTPIAYCENDRYAQSVLLSRMARGQLPVAPIWDDVKTLRGEFLPEVDVIYGGFPCQDISLAGHGKGLDGERSKLFYEITRLVGELRPRFVFLENVAAIVVRGLGDVLGAFTELGYDCRWQINRASDFGARHHRARWWLLAHSNGTGGRIESKSRTECQDKTDPLNNGEKRDVADTRGERLEARRNRRWHETQNFVTSDQGKVIDRGYWSTEPDVCRVVNGLPNRVDRIKCLGNAVVPLQAREAFKSLMGIE